MSDTERAEVVGTPYGLQTINTIIKKPGKTDITYNNGTFVRVNMLFL